MTDAALATDVHQALNVHLDFRAKLTFYTDLRDDLANFGDFLIGPILDALVFRDSGLGENIRCLLYTSPSPRDRQKSRMPSSA